MGKRRENQGIRELMKFMKPKMQSAIEKITLNDATFSEEIIEPTFVNFFYGKNGARNTL